MGTSGNKQDGFKFMTLVPMRNVTRRSWYAILMPDTVIAQLNALGQGQPNDLDFLDFNKHPIGEIDITRVDYGGTEAPNIGLVEPETDINPISAGAETLPELV